MKMNIKYWEGKLVALLAFMTVAISCEKIEADGNRGLIDSGAQYFEVSGTTIGALGNGTVDKVLKISSTVEWSIDNSESWFEVTGEGVVGDNLPLSISVDEAPDVDSREGVFYVTAEGYDPIKVTLTQIGADVALTVNNLGEVEVSVDETGAVVAPANVIVYSNAPWSAVMEDVADTWVHMSVSEGEKLESVTMNLTFDENPDPIGRDAVILIQVEGVTVAKIIITQAKKIIGPVITINGGKFANLEVDNAGNITSIEPIVVTSNMDWTAVLADDANNWVKFTNLHGSAGETTISGITFDAGAATSREATINIVAAGEVCCEIYVMQEGQAATMEDGLSPETAFLLENEADLEALAEEVINGDSKADVYYRVAKAITLTSTWEPMGDEDNPFQGHIDGNGKVIAGIEINKITKYVGFIGLMTGGSIRDITLQGSITNDGDWTQARIGGIIGEARDAVTFGGIISSDVSIKVANAGNSGDEMFIGGVVGSIASTDQSSILTIEDGTEFNYGLGAETTIDTQGKLKMYAGGIFGNYAANYHGGTNTITYTNGATSMVVRSERHNDGWGAGVVLGGLVGYYTEDIDVAANPNVRYVVTAACEKIYGQTTAIDVNKKTVTCAVAGVVGNNEGTALGLPELCSVPKTTTITAKFAANPGADFDMEWSCLAVGIYQARGDDLWSQNEGGGNDNLVLDFYEGYPGEQIMNGDWL